MKAAQPDWFNESLSHLLPGRSLPAKCMADAMRAITSGTAEEVHAAAFLTALRCKGETALEIEAAVLVLREKMVRLNASAGPVIDTCGTGGDGSGTFNISTATALVVASTGCKVVKHGNRSVSSRSGSADALAALGVPIEKGPAWAQDCLDRFGFAFCFAPQFHPALAHVGPVRRKLGTRTIFNLLGPLLNPAGAAFQLLGVGSLELLDPIAGAVARLGVRQAFLVASADGLDEISLAASTHVRHVKNGEISSNLWNHRDFDLEPAWLHDLKADGPVESAAVIEQIIQGQDGPARRVVLANAAAALLAAEQVESLPAGVQLAAQAIDSGKARNLLERLRSS